MNNGWICLHRDLLQNKIFHNEKLLKVWIWCLLRANHQKKETMIGLTKVTLNPGEFITGRYAAAKELKIPPGSFWRYINFLETEQCLVTKSSNKFTVVTIVNWGIYQSSEKQNEQQMSSKRAANEQQMSTDNNVNNANNVNKKIYTLEFESFWETYSLRRTEKKGAFKSWNARLKEGKTPEEIIQAAKNYMNDCKQSNRETQFIKHPKTFLGPNEHISEWNSKGQAETQKHQPTEQELEMKRLSKELETGGYYKTTTPRP